MKKINSMLVALAAIMCVFAFASCGDDDDNSTVNNQVTYPYVTYMVEVSEDLMKFVDAEITYYDSEGQLQTQAYTEKAGLNFKPTKSQKVGITLTVTPKSNISELIAAEQAAYNAAVQADPSTAEPTYSFGYTAFGRWGIYNETTSGWNQIYANGSLKPSQSTLRLSKLEDYFSKAEHFKVQSYQGSYDVAANSFVNE